MASFVPSGLYISKRFVKVSLVKSEMNNYELGLWML